jgi:hypothetical protein
VSGYGLNDRAIEVPSPAEAKGFFLLTSLSRPTLGLTQPLVQWVRGEGGPFPGGKARPGREADHSPPSSAEVEKEYELCLLSSSVACGATALAFRFVYPRRLETGIRQYVPSDQGVPVVEFGNAALLAGDISCTAKE